VRGREARRFAAYGLLRFEETGTAIQMTNSKKNTNPVQSQSTTTSPAIAPVTPPTAAPPTASPPPAAAPVDPNAALEQYVTETVASFDTIEVGLGDDPSLTPIQKRHGAKLRKGGQSIFAQIGNLAQQEQIESPALSVDDMTASLGRAAALQPLANRIAAFQKHVQDIIFIAQGQAVVVGLQLYALLQKRAASNTELAAALAPATTFFAYRHPSTKAPGTLNKRAQKATKKALATVKKNAPGMLLPAGGTTAAPATGAGTGQTPVTQGASGQGQAGAAVPAANGAGAAPSGNGAAAPAGQTGVAHS
jgi:hypothetical protein